MVHGGSWCCSGALWNVMFGAGACKEIRWRDIETIDSIDISKVEINEMEGTRWCPIDS